MIGKGIRIRLQFHPCFASKAKLNSFNILRPMPPWDFRIHNFSQLIQAIFLSSPLCPHQKFRTILINSSHTVCVWVQIFFYAFAFGVSKRWDPCYRSNTFSGMATTFSPEWHCLVGPVHTGMALFSGSRALFTGPTISLFSNFFIKNESHGTIYAFKNYFATMFLVFNKISGIQTDP